MAWHHFVAYLVTAIVLGAVIGAERQYHQRIAGLRTNALVSAGAAMFVSISLLVPLNPTTCRWLHRSFQELVFPGCWCNHARRT